MRDPVEESAEDRPASAQARHAAAVSGVVAIGGSGSSPIRLALGVLAAATSIARDPSR